MNLADQLIIETVVRQMEDYTDLVKDCIENHPDDRMHNLTLGLSNQTNVITTRNMVLIMRLFDKLSDLEQKVDHILDNMETKPA